MNHTSPFRTVTPNRSGPTQVSPLTSNVTPSPGFHVASRELDGDDAV
jgi:hypothetical protein